MFFRPRFLIELSPLASPVLNSGACCSDPVVEQDCLPWLLPLQKRFNLLAELRATDEVEQKVGARTDERHDATAGRDEAIHAKAMPKLIFA